MTVLYGTITAPRGANPVGVVDGSLQGGHVRCYREIITLATQTTSDTIVVALPSKGESFLYGIHTTDTSLGSSTLAMGATGATGKYRAAAVFTTTLTPTLFGAVLTNLNGLSAKLTADEVSFITIATASLPASGTYIVDMYFAQT